MVMLDLMKVIGFDPDVIEACEVDTHAHSGSLPGYPGGCDPCWYVNSLYVNRGSSTDLNLQSIMLWKAICFHFSLVQSRGGAKSSIDDKPLFERIASV
jgi:hypothetical protein